MKKLMLLALLATTVAFGQQAAAPGANKSKAKVLTRAEFDALLAHPEKLVVIDVRRPDEVHDIGGFPVYLSIQIKDLEKSLAWIPKDRVIVAVSNHAGRGGQAADILARHGFDVAGAVGAQNYEQEGGTLTKIVAPPRPANAPNGKNE